ncbi:acyl-CoA thioester hydrolase [Modestobacter sp. DSM 44400]|uniref:acyl-CoA thioesterase n=1 Tax=Modestobacter sp. DSM 44400 TaxID=1550230 RepID=UPI0008952234|nr:thioesterase family protein [Modestobacter sp. DSM 44400]SDY62868.1 acyl-CoA thioester hydrolase [Modestobacter sp. DSM 44400]
MRHEHLVQLRWSDPDSLGHVNHARALSLIEDARLAMVADLPGEPGLILARLEVDYFRQLYYRTGERLVVRTVVTRIGTKSFAVRQELVQDDEVAIHAVAVMVTFDFATDSSRPLTDAERAHWSRYLGGVTRQ